MRVRVGEGGVENLGKLRGDALNNGLCVRAVSFLLKESEKAGKKRLFGICPYLYMYFRSFICRKFGTEVLQ